MATKKNNAGKSVETLTHEEAKRKNVPTAEHSSAMEREAAPRVFKYPRNADRDPQLVWRGKDQQDWSDLVAHAPPLYIQGNPKALTDDLLRVSKEAHTRRGR